MLKRVSLSAAALVLMLGNSALAQERMDFSKMLTEFPLKKSIAPLPRVPIIAEETGDKCQPGKVQWHKDEATAGAASRISGKPVMLFVMLGNLDDKFC